MYTENSKLTISLLEVFKEIFKPIVLERGLKTPEHFDLMIETYLVSQIITIFPKILDSQTEKNLVDYLYSSNLHKIKMANLTPKGIQENYTFGIYYEDYVIESIRQGYNLISNNEAMAKKLIKETLELNINEIKMVNNSYRDFAKGNGKIKIPVNFFINCFVHPILLFPNKDYIINEHKIEIDNLCEPVFRNLSKEFSIFIKEYINS